MESSTSSCLRNVEKLGTTKATEKRRSRDPGEIWTISPVTTVEKRVIMLGTTIDQLKPGPKKIQRLSEKLGRRNRPTNPLEEETRKHW